MQRLNKTVERRYSDFEPLDSLLHKRFPYRIIPSLPPKAFGSKNSDAEFLEKRRKGLGRCVVPFLPIVVTLAATNTVPARDPTSLDGRGYCC